MHVATHTYASSSSQTKITLKTTISDHN